MTTSNFSDSFKALTGHDPFPWQEKLYERFDGDIPRVVAVPTGLGKTSVIAVWLIALARGKNVPRRLVYVVNRRTVVDQTTNEAIKLRNNAKAIGIEGLAISTLRGQFADNREWSADPSRPAVICGTVDMIGSRLLFSGYGIGFKSRPLHAGFLGQDALLVHDEAHLEPAFQKLIGAIAAEQECCRRINPNADRWPLHVMQLTATIRNDSGPNAPMAFTLTPKDRTHPIVKQRLEARKHLSLTPVKDEKLVADKIAEIAIGHKDANVAVLVFVRTLDAVAAIESKLAKTDRKVALLTGTMRGLERDALVRQPVFIRFLLDKDRAEGITPAEGTVYLVCTSAGEVGIDISADHMVCDLSTLESMVQRLGRVNRFGEGEARIDVVHPSTDGFDDKHPLTPARKATLALLDDKLHGDASPKAMGELLSSLSDDKRKAAFAPEPTILPATDILFDAWALTTIRGKLPGRPPVEPYLHGVAEWELRETYVAWRQEVEFITGDLLEQYDPADLLDDYPLLPHELLRDATDRKSTGVSAQLSKMAKRASETTIWIIDVQGEVKPARLQDVVDGNSRRLYGATVILPPSIGGLTAAGTLDGDAPFENELRYDVADIADGPNQRIRVWSDDEGYEAKTANMRRVRPPIEFASEKDDDEPRRWEWFDSFPLEGGRTASKPVALDTHVGDVVKHAKPIVEALSLPQEIADAVILAAELHDHGKTRECFQITLGNRRYPDVLLAKAGKRGARLPEPFRHEFASMLDAKADGRLDALGDEMKDLVLHLIAAHHGRARPHFTAEEALDLDPPNGVSPEYMAIETPRRFARLQRRYGRWGLAYLESLLRAADWAASAAPSKVLDGKGKEVAS